MSLHASYAKKRNITWVGYKVHFTEICEEQVPHLITQVTTTDGAVTDDTALTDIQEGLERQELLPEQHLVDAGYVDAHLLVNSQNRFGVDLVGPTRGDHKWQARQQTGFDASQIQIDWDNQQAICPQGQVSMGWTEAHDGDRAVVKVKFSYAICRRCSCHDVCTLRGMSCHTPVIQQKEERCMMQPADTPPQQESNKKRGERRLRNSTRSKRCPDDTPGTRVPQEISEVPFAIALSLLRPSDNH